MSLLATCVFVTLMTLTWGQQPPCYDLLSGESYEITNTHPDTDIYAHGTMNASLVLPATSGTKNWRVVVKFSRAIDELHSTITTNSSDKTQFEFRSRDGDTVDTDLSLPFSAKYTGGSPELIIQSVHFNDRLLCITKLHT